jgi:glycosyltransferase involved in cell wall biosynthesis
MRILIVNNQVPFVRGGAESHEMGLYHALSAAGHDVDILRIAFKWYPPSRVLKGMLGVELLDVDEFSGVKIDLCVGLRFPAYLIRHPRKVLWVLHQHRSAYELWGTDFGGLHDYPDGALVRDAIIDADITAARESVRVYANSQNVANRLKRYCQIDSTPLYHPPPLASSLHCAGDDGYLFYPSRVNLIKRQHLVIEALPHTRLPVQIKFSGTGESDEYQNSLQSLARRLGVSQRIEWLGQVDDATLAALYSRCRGVIFPPFDEDYGYITLEAMLSHKPVITCTDSGGPLEFVTTGVNGFVAEPTPEALAAALDELWADPARARTFGERSYERYMDRKIGWPSVVATIESCA